MKSKKRILVTGGAGFIGANFVHLLLRDTDAEVVVLDKLTYAGHRESLADAEADPRFRFERGDIADAPSVARLIADSRPSAIVNFAAESHVDRSIDGPADFVETNIVGAFTLLEAARHHLANLEAESRERFRFLHVSTDEVYGSLGRDGLFTEATPYAPNSPYAASKAAADHLVRAYCETYGLPALITNCSNNYGPYQFPEKLIPLMIMNALEARPLPVYGDGSNVRDWIYVEDHCRGVLAALERGTPGEKYNLGGDSERSNLDVVTHICDLVEEARPAADNARLRAAGHSAYRQLITHVTDRPGHDFRYAIDASKAKAELDWRPERDFDRGLRETVRWYLDHLDWCRAVSGGERYDRERLGLDSAQASSSTSASSSAPASSSSSATTTTADPA